MNTIKIDLTIERGEDEKLWGRVNYKGNLISDYADSIAELEVKFKFLLEDFEEVDRDRIAFSVSSTNTNQ